MAIKIPTPPDKVALVDNMGKDSDGKTAKSGRTLLVRFASWLELVEYGNGGAKHKCVVPSHQRASRSTTTNDWSGGSYTDAISMAYRGCTETGQAAARAMEKYYEYLAPRGGNLLSKFEQDMHGSVFDIGKFCSGEPDHWLRFTDDHNALVGLQTPVDLIINHSAAGGNSGEELARYGGAIAALAAALVSLGCSVNVWVVDTARRGGYGTQGEHKILLTAPVYQAGDNWDLDLVSYAIGHPSVLRRIFFSAEELLPEYWRNAIGIPGGYGGACPWPKDVPIRELDERQTTPVHYYLGSMYRYTQPYLEGGGYGPRPDDRDEQEKNLLLNVVRQLPENLRVLLLDEAHGPAALAEEK